MFTQITRITQGLRLTDLPPPQAELTFTVPCHVWQHFLNADKCLLPEEHSAALFTSFHTLMFFHLWHFKLGFYSRVATYKEILFRCSHNADFCFSFQGRSVGLGFITDQVGLVRHSLRPWCWTAPLEKVWFGQKSLWTVKARRSTASPSRRMTVVKVLMAATARNPTSKSFLKIWVLQIHAKTHFVALHFRF